MPDSLGLESQAALEEAADELARLDEICTLVPASASRILWLLTVAELTDPRPELLHALVAAEGDSFHDAALSPPALLWRDLITDQERRTRGGAFLSTTRFTELVPALATYAERGRLEAIWRESGCARPVLVRALDSAAWWPSGTEQAHADAGDLTAALLLCGGGRTDRIRVLPFAGIPAETRTAALHAWRAGDQEPWALLALAAAAHRARERREGLRRVHAMREREEVTLGSMGRAGISARRALDALRTFLAMSMPALAEELELSRPATAAALERLTAAGLLREVTARARDRVYAYAPAVALAESVLAS